MCRSAQSVAIATTFRATRWPVPFAYFASEAAGYHMCEYNATSGSCTRAKNTFECYPSPPPPPLPDPPLPPASPPPSARGASRASASASVAPASSAATSTAALAVSAAAAAT